MTRRRRVLIAVASLAVLVGGLWWITSPYHDPRFIGLWTVEGFEGVAYRFYADGSVEGAGSTWRWFVAGNRLVMKPDPPDLLNRFRNWVTLIVATATNTTDDLHSRTGMVFQIIDVDEKRAIFHRDGGDFIFVRHE